MIETLITVASIAIVLLALSFMMNDRFQEIEDQVEQLSINVMQDNYQLKKKMKVLEEELLQDDITEEKRPSQTDGAFRNKPPMVTTVQSLADSGYSIKEIARKTELGEQNIHSILNQSKGVQS
ncbi:hypothetical protein [Thalassobacillus sp. CUG 92003]|uniref:hypothetical protein n=1 Tax=Thalassobacillus sp. CUG 92003 TaxID=2736641 RepID=UPI00351A62A2